VNHAARGRVETSSRRVGKVPGPLPRNHRAGGEPGRYVRSRISRQALALPGTRRGRRESGPASWPEASRGDDDAGDAGHPERDRPGAPRWGRPSSLFHNPVVSPHKQRVVVAIRISTERGSFERGIVTGGGPERRETQGPPAEDGPPDRSTRRRPCNGPSRGAGSAWSSLEGHGVDA
jgi:hypothetical protein